ncbi:MAG: hypothetical protein AAGJ54_07145 [Planctomycetota bacterium]
MNRIAALGVCAIAALSLAPVSSLAQSNKLGPLEPPIGAVSDTGPDLFQIEPRTPLSLETTPGDANSIYRIETPGHYYLTGDLKLGGAALNFNAIEVGASDVTIDLNGFRIDGIGAGRSGVIVDGLLARVTVKNGSVMNFTLNGVRASGRMSVVQDVRVSNIVGDQSWGIDVGLGGLVERCTVETVTTYGIETGADSVVRDCRVIFSDVNGISVGAYSRVESSVASVCTTDGFRLGIGASAVDCAARNNGRDGFHAPTLGSITRCVSVSNDRNGFTLDDNGTVRSSVARMNDNGFVTGPNARLENNNSDENTSGGYEIEDASIAVGNAARDNGGYGFRVRGRGSNVNRNLSVGHGYNFWCFGQGALDNSFTQNVAQNAGQSNYYISGNENFFHAVDSAASATPLANISQ